MLALRILTVFITLNVPVAQAPEAPYWVIQEDSACLAIPASLTLYDSIIFRSKEKVPLLRCKSTDTLKLDFSPFTDNLYELHFTTSPLHPEASTTIPLVLDRNSGLKAKAHVSEFLLGRRDPNDVMQNLQWEAWSASKNHVSFVSLWDKDSLYFLIRVQDSHLVHEPATAMRAMQQSDAIAILFDSKHNHAHLTSENHYKLYVDVLGNHALYAGNFGTDTLLQSAHRISTAVSLQGTVNNPFDQDRSYLVRISIPWKLIQVNPKANVVVGFDLVNYDQDQPGGSITQNSWSGSQNNYTNPSEWGNLVLYRDNNLGRIFLMVFIVLLFVVNFYFLARRKTKYDTENLDDIHVANSIHEFIRKNISDTSLSPSSIARYLNLRTNYINQLFHDVKQTTLQEAIEKERQILVKELKRKKHLSDTEIMQKTGIKTREELLKKLG